MSNRNKVRPIKKLSDLETLGTIQLLGYADIAHSTMNELMVKGRDLFNAQYLKLISAEDNQPNLDQMQKNINEYADAHNAVIIEIGNRFKKDMKVGLAPIQCTAMVEKIKEKFPDLAKYDSQTLTHMAQEKAAKDRAEENKKKREREEAEAKAKPETTSKKKPSGKVAKLEVKK